MDQGVYNTIAALYGLLAASAVVLNAVVILTFCKVRALLMPASIPILSLAIADVLLAVTAMPLGIAANACHRWIFGSAGCNWYAFAYTVVGLSSILHHAVIAFERCRTIHQPLKRHFHKRSMTRIIVFVWGFVAVWCFFPILGWSSYVPEGGGAVCSIKWHSLVTSDSIFVICTFVIFFYVPSCLIFACYTAIALNLRKMSKMAKKTWGKNSQITRDRVLVQKRAIKHGAIMVAAVLLTWLPYAIVASRAIFSEPAGNMSALIYSIAAMFAKTSTLMNPVICFFWYRRFREGTKKLWTWSRRNLLQHRRGCSQISIARYTGQSVVFQRDVGSRSL